MKNKQKTARVFSYQNPVGIDGASDPATCEYIGRFQDGFPMYGLCAADDGTTMKSCWVEDPDGDGTLDTEDDYIYDEDAFNNGESEIA